MAAESSLEVERARVAADVAADATVYGTADRVGALQSLATWRAALVVIAVFSGAGGFLRWGLHARIDGATGGLLVAGAALALCLFTLYRMVNAVARPSLQTVVEVEAGLGVLSDRELREERRRLLRAINELRFDFEMGKLSQSDYDAVREGYELRAIEVMRVIDAGAALHPELAARLGRRDPTPEAEPQPEAAPASEPAPESSAQPEAATTPEPASEAATKTELACAACDTRNDPDARFCKHCGKELAA